MQRSDPQPCNGDNPVTDQSAPRTIDEYIAEFPPEVQSILEKIRATVRKASPQAAEKISYRMPAFALDGRDLVYFGAFKKHIGLYPPIRGDEELKKAAAPYAGDKGSLRFPFAEPIPYALISRIVKSRAKQLHERRTPTKAKTSR